MLTPEALRALPFIHLSWGTEFEQWFRAVFGRHFLPAVEVDHMSLFLRWMLTGEGVGFLLKSIAEGMAAAGELKVLPFRSDPPLPGIPVYLVLPKRKRSSGGLNALVNHLLYTE